MTSPVLAGRYVAVMCLICMRSSPNLLCPACSSCVRSAGVVAVGGLQVASGLIHDGVARRLVHLLKYKGIEPAAAVLASTMVSSLPTDALALAPVPRAFLRRIKYGVDPAVLLARHVAVRTGLPVISALSAPMWWPSHAGERRSGRNAPRFRANRSISDGLVLVDDVLTTGATLRAAHLATGAEHALTATRADNTTFG